MIMETVLITGGTGLIGRTLTEALINKGYRVIVLTRDIANKGGNDRLSYAHWDVKKQTIDVNALQAADYIIHLAGAGVVDKKWTEAYKKEILESRTNSSKLIVETLSANSNKVKAIISSSAIGWYGPDKTDEIPFTENDPSSPDFLGETCSLWEQSVEEAEKIGIRVCKLRTGIVLANDGGAMKEFKRPVLFGIAPILGSGKQMVSWIHIDDLCRMFVYAMENATMKGSYNAVAPNPISNKTLMLTLAKIMRGRFFIPMHVPSFVLKIMMGSRSIEVLKSTTVSCGKIKKEGFTFLYPSIEAAINQLIKKRS
jgi:uncharacterized protein (TIGR01777 family)